MRKNVMVRMSLIAVAAALCGSSVFATTAKAESQWCRLVRDGDRGGSECIFYTFAQCAASSERLNGGGCYENPGYRGRLTPATIRGPGTASRESHQSGAAYRQSHYPGWTPNAQGGTTGGSVYPGVSTDHREHGYNGG
jgi:hypothetical protein